MLSLHGRGSIKAAGPEGSNIPNMEVVGSTVLPIVLQREDKDRNISVLIVRDLAHAFVSRARFFRSDSCGILVRGGQGVPVVDRGPVGAVPAAGRGHEEFLGPVLCNATR